MSWLSWWLGTAFSYAYVYVCVLFCFRQVLELAIRGGKRETIHKGPLRVLAVGKEGGVRLEYFYVFNDVVSCIVVVRSRCGKEAFRPRGAGNISINEESVSKVQKRCVRCANHT